MRSQAPPALFDLELRARRRDRAARTEPELFLYERAFEDCVDRMALVQRPFERALLIGCPDSRWPKRLRERVSELDVLDPGPLFAKAAGGATLVEERWDPQLGVYDFVLAIGTLDTVNDLPRALSSIFLALKPGALFLGALSGGDTLPQLRQAMRAADSVTGSAAPHIHPRIEASALAPLLAQAGFVNAVVDIDRIPAAYRTLDRLVVDLRGMAATNVLVSRPRFLSKKAREAAIRNFAEAGDGERTIETFEILHFAGWTPAKS